VMTLCRCSGRVVKVLEAEAGIGRLKRRFVLKNTQFRWLHKLTLSLQEPAPSVHRC